MPKSDEEEIEIDPEDEEDEPEEPDESVFDPQEVLEELEDQGFEYDSDAGELIYDPGRRKHRRRRRVRMRYDPSPRRRRRRRSSRRRYDPRRVSVAGAKGVIWNSLAGYAAGQIVDSLFPVKVVSLGPVDVSGGNLLQLGGAAYFQFGKKNASMRNGMVGGFLIDKALDMFGAKPMDPQVSGTGGAGGEALRGRLLAGQGVY